MVLASVYAFNTQGWIRTQISKKGWGTTQICTAKKGERERDRRPRNQIYCAFLSNMIKQVGLKSLKKNQIRHCYSNIYLYTIVIPYLPTLTFSYSNSFNGIHISESAWVIQWNTCIYKYIVYSFALMTYMYTEYVHTEYVMCILLIKNVCIEHWLFVLYTRI